jgi:hypothetical protein
VRLVRHSPWHKREPGGAHDRRCRLWNDSRSFLVLVAIGVAATRVKAATCERDKKLVHRTVPLKRIEAIKSACERLAVREGTKAEALPAINDRQSARLRF